MNETKTNKFVYIVGNSRSGCSFLRSGLEQHPNVYTIGDVFNLGSVDKEQLASIDIELYGKPSLNYALPPLRVAAQNRWPCAHYEKLQDYVSKVHSKPNLSKADKWNLMVVKFRKLPCHYSAWDTIFTEADKIFVTMRYNIWHMYISDMVAYKTNCWSLHKSYQFPEETEIYETFIVNPMDVLDYILYTEYCYKYMVERSRRCKQGKVVWVTYDDLAKDTLVEYGKAIEQLDLTSPANLVVKTRKRIQDYAGWVRNYDEVKDYFIGTRWEDFFKE